jgi:hypothetical protein
MEHEKSIEQKKVKKRSPAYPAINLETALERTTELEAKEHDAAVNVDVTVGHWGYAPKSSPGQRILSALKQYGLIEDVEGSGKDRMIRLSQLALDIILDGRPGSLERSEKIKQAALTPPIFRKLYDNSPNEPASDQSLTFYLTRKEDFNPRVVRDFIEVWKETFTFAQLGNSDMLFEDKRQNQEFKEGPRLIPPDKNPPRQTIEFRDNTLSLGGGRDVILRAPKIMSKDDFDFMIQWLNRLNLVTPEPPRQSTEQDGTDEEKQGPL